MLGLLLAEWNQRQLPNMVSSSCQQVKKLTTEEEKRSRERSDKIDALLAKISRIKKITVKFAEETKLKAVLNVMRKPEYKMSAATNKIAEELYQRFEKQNWGEPVTPAMSATTSGLKSKAPAHHNTSRRVQTANTSTAVPTSVSLTLASSNTTTLTGTPSLRDVKQVLQFGANHHLFGDRAVMRGVKVRVNKTKNKMSYFLSKSQKHKRADTVGHNGHSVGDWWPLQICLVRDGVHGSLQGGIYGNSATGAYSITILGDSVYSEMDQDVDGELHYSGSGSLENTDPDNPKETGGTAALQASALAKTPTRVIRGKSKKKASAPKEGFRYDGLYQVVSQTQLINKKGGAYLQFKLERVAAQPDINKSRPNVHDLTEFRAIKEAIKQKRG